MLLAQASAPCCGCAASRARAGRRGWNARLGRRPARPGDAGYRVRAGMLMARQLAGGWTASTRQACFTHGFLQPYHAPQAQPYRGDSGDAGQDHENSAKPPHRGLHPGPGQPTPHSEATSPSALGSGLAARRSRRLGRCWHERIAHDRVAAGPAAARQAPNSVTSQQVGGHPSQPHGPTAACGDGVPAPGAILAGRPAARPGIPGSAELGQGIGQRGQHGGVVRWREDDDRQVQAQVAERGRGVSSPTRTARCRGLPATPRACRARWCSGGRF